MGGFHECNVPALPPALRSSWVQSLAESYVISLAFCQSGFCNWIRRRQYHVLLCIYDKAETPTGRCDGLCNGPFGSLFISLYVTILNLKLEMEMMVRQFIPCSCMRYTHAGDVLLEKGLLFEFQCKTTANGNAVHQ